EPLAYRYSDYTGFIFTEKENECLKLIINHLYEADDWDLIYLLDFPGTSSVLEILPRISTDILPFELEQGRICPYISLPSSMETIISGLTGKFRKNLRRSLSKLKQDYGRVELKRYDEIGTVEQSMNRFFDLHQKRWIAQGMPGVYKDENTRSVFIELAKLYAKKGWLALYFLTVNDRPIATQYCLAYKQTMHYGLGGFDPVFSRYSVGNIIIAKVLEHCIANRFTEYDFMKGDESYKFDWSAEYRRNMGIKFVNMKLSSKMLFRGIKAARKIGANRTPGKLFGS
ncbi:MAG TPA: GNAT family N-acetyltransferase, partial [Candidatus Binatia bacterium]|nr:GNAT family N-acetyltransferase [Candidatus Binatia bacterium]